MTERKARFVTNPVLVTGDTPELMEAAALTRVRHETSESSVHLEVYTPYSVGFVSDDGQTTAASAQAAERGHKLYAKISVICWREVSDDEPRDVAGDSGSPADPAGVRAPADPALGADLGPLEAAS